MSTFLTPLTTHLRPDAATQMLPLRQFAPAPRTSHADLQVVRSAMADDSRAKEQLATELAALPAMLRVKNLRLGSPLRPHELDDVVQNTLLAILRKLATFDGRGALLRWAYGIGVIELLRALERRRRRREQDHASEPVVPEAEPTVDRERVAAALATLDPDDRNVVEQKHFAAATFEEIAARTGEPISTVKSRYYRALQRLRTRLTPTMLEDR